MLTIVHIEAAALKVARALAVFGLLILLGYATMTLADGLLRSIANSPIEAVQDLASVVVAVAVSCCFPLAFLQRSNITIKFMETFLGHRVGRALDAVAAMLVATVAVLIARQIFIFADNEYRGGDATVMLEIKTAPFWFFVAAVMAFAALTQALVALRGVLRCFGQCDPPDVSSESH